MRCHKIGEKKRFILYKSINYLDRKQGAISSSFVPDEDRHPVCWPTLARTLSGLCIVAQGLKAVPLSRTTRWKRPLKTRGNVYIQFFFINRNLNTLKYSFNFVRDISKGVGWEFNIQIIKFFKKKNTGDCAIFTLQHLI